MPSLQSFVNLLTLENTLIGLTIIGVAALLAYIFRTRKNIDPENHSPGFVIIIAVCALGFAMCCSYNLLFEPCVPSIPVFAFLLNPFVRFLLNILVVLLIILLIAIAVVGILDPWRIEITARLFGAEFSFKKKFEASQESLDQVRRQAEQTEELLEQIFQDWQDWSGLIARLNESVLEAICQPRIHRATKDASDSLLDLREWVRAVLVQAYSPLAEHVEIYVLPAIEEAFASLDPTLAAKASLAFESTQRAMVIDQIGFAIARRADGHGIIVILEGLDDYEVSPAETAAAGILLAVLVNEAA